MSWSDAAREEARKILDAAAEVAESFEAATGFSCILLDDRGQTLVQSPAACGVCRELRGSACTGLHLYAASQSEVFGGCYIYLCPIGMLYWTSPVFSGDTPVGSLVGGPARSIDREEAIEELSSLGSEKAAACVDAIPEATPERVKALSELLSAAADKVSFTFSTKAAVSLAESRAKADQQSRISDAIHEIKSRSSSGESLQAYPIAKERELLDAIRRGDEGGARKILNDLLGTVFFSSGQRFELIKFRGLELVVLLSRAAAEAGASVEDALSLDYRFLKRFQEIQTPEDLAYLIDAVLARFVALAFSFRAVKHASAIEKGLRFARKRLTTGVTLADTASAAGLSSAYFSRIFKEETGESFSEHLNRLRVERAAALLLGGDDTLAEIATKVGFEDQSYFTKVFKRVKGVSPGRYRSSGGRIVGDNQEIHGED